MRVSDRLRRILMLVVLPAVAGCLWLLPLPDMFGALAVKLDEHPLAGAIAYLVLFPICAVFLAPASLIAMSLFVFLGTRARSVEQILSGELATGPLSIVVALVTVVTIVALAVLPQNAASSTWRKELDE